MYIHEHFINIRNHFMNEVSLLSKLAFMYICMLDKLHFVSVFLFGYSVCLDITVD